MPLDLWQSYELIPLQQDDRQAPPDGFWGRYFPGTFTSEAEEILFDQLPDMDRRMAPFVAPHVQGRVMRAKGQAMASFKPAYLKPKHVVDPSMAVPRMPGEAILGSLSLEERFNRIVADRLRLQREMIERRWDWMQAQALIYGYVDVAGEDYTPVRVDFARDASLTITLSGGALWDAGTADPLADIGLARTRGFALGKSPIRDFYFGTSAWAAFESNEGVRTRLLNTQMRGSESVFSTTGLNDGSPVEFMGRIAGPNGTGLVNLWLYSNSYENPVTGLLEEVLDPRDVVGVGGAVQGIKCFGAIRDKRAGLRATPMFPKMWENEDPSVTYVMTQSAPLMVPRNVNNTVRLRVLTA